MTKIDDMIAELCPDGSNSQGSDCLRWEIGQSLDFASLQRLNGHKRGY